MTLIEEAEAMADRLQIGRIGKDGVRRAPDKVKREAAALIRRMADELGGEGKPPKLHPPIYHDGDNFDEVVKLLNNPSPPR